MSEQTTTWEIVAWSVGLTLIPLLSGAAHVETVVCITTAVVCAAGFGLYFHRGTLNLPKGITLFVLLLWGITFLQWIPLPATLLETFLPGTFLSLNFAYRGLEIPNFSAWSLDGTLTFHRWLQYTCLLPLILLCSLSPRLRGSHAFERITVSAALACCVGILLLETVSWRPINYQQFTHETGVGPFVNPNHAGGFLLLIHFWCIHAATKLERLWRWSAVIVAVFSFALIAMTLSRAAIVALPLGLAFAIAIPIFTYRRLSRPSILILFSVIFVSCGFIWFEWMTFRPVILELLSLGSSTDSRKFIPWQALPYIVSDHPFGIGPGGLFVALGATPIDLISSGRIFYLENFVLQLIADFGPWLASLIALAGYAWFRGVFSKRLLSENPFFYTGVIVLGAHNLVDFNLTLLSVQVWLVFGISCFSARLCEARHLRVSTVGGRIALIVFVACGVVGGAFYGARGLPLRYQGLQAELKNSDSENEIFEILYEFKQHHPRDAFGDLVAAQHLSRLDVPLSTVLARINVAMVTYPQFAAPNLLASEILLRFGADVQAVGEFIRAFEKHPHLVKTKYLDLLKRLPKAEVIERSINLRPELRYELWSQLRKIGVAFHEVIVDDVNWLDTHDRISLRMEALRALGRDEQMLQDCSIWTERYPSLSYCEWVEFEILKRRGEESGVREKLRERWERQPSDVNRALTYTRTLLSKEQCPTLVKIYDDNISIFRFTREQRAEFDANLVRCLVLLDYRNRLENTLRDYLASDVSAVRLLAMLELVREIAPKRFALFCEQHASVIERQLGNRSICN